ncbi:unnamed protein product [Polarella glacialis]|uniref:CMP/dCMP-type deaminase domain-containing protein n=1 Tax=Polarella glacialis TaxID=89957 RepID=A0A813DZV6_POLGL|nr:unnamed protein product [Polarella glacialis]
MLDAMVVGPAFTRGLGSGSKRPGFAFATGAHGVYLVTGSQRFLASRVTRESLSRLWISLAPGLPLGRLGLGPGRSFRPRVLKACRRSLQTAAELGDSASKVGSAAIHLPDPSGPFRSFETYGWSWREGSSLDDNMLSLAFVGRLNCHKMLGFTTGMCSAMLCHPPRTLDDSGCIEVDVIGFGVNAPPRFAPASCAWNPRLAETASEQFEARWLDRRKQKSKKPHNEIHAEVQLIARCAREGISVKGSWLYVALPPCWECCKVLVAAGIARVVFKGYGVAEKELGLRERLHAEAAGVEWVPAYFSREREAYVHGLFEAWKLEEGLDREGLKELASERPL